MKDINIVAGTPEEFHAPDDERDNRRLLRGGPLARNHQNAE
jgi:hypothetical protein